MGKIFIDAVSAYKRIYRPNICEECPLYDDTLWCLYYKRRIAPYAEPVKPDWCHVVSVTVEEGD